MKISNMTQKALERFHRDDGGAVALVMLAAFLALFMMGMVIYDANISVADKMDVQVAADTAAWSQTSIEARSMNMVAFTNVGKRITVGITSMYVAAKYANYFAIALWGGLAAACWAANAVCPGPCGSLTPLCTRLTKIFLAAVDILMEEMDDINEFDDNLSENYFGEDLKALHNYQMYMIDITPWWAWAEGVLRGAQNGATATAVFPTPDTLAGGAFAGLTDLAEQSGVEDELPVGPSEGDGSSEMCDAATQWGPDRGVHFSIFNVLSWPTVSGTWETIAMGTIVGALAAMHPLGCNAMMSRFEGYYDGSNFGSFAEAVDVKRYDSESEWNMRKSNLVLAYQGDPDRMDDDSGDRKKYGFIDRDYNLNNEIYKAPGYWAFSRAEISYRGDQDANEWKWNPRWTTRMRPVALPGEWDGLGDDIQMKHAWRDMGPLMVATATVLNLTGMSGGDVDLENAVKDILRMDAIASGMDDDLIEGTPK
ncbi:MAG: TadE/TadG family type IV pilus assembly protein [Myxococcota bacterium]